MNTSVTYIASAAQTAFSIPYPFLSPSHIGFAVDGVAKVNGVDFTVAGSTVTWIGTAFVGAESVFLFRITPILENDLVVDFAAGAAITEESLDNMQRQLLYALQELTERVARDELLTSLTAALDANNRKITNVGTPSVASDAVNKQYADNIVAGAGNLPAVTGGDNDSGMAVVAGVWAIQTKAQLQALWDILTQSAADARYLQISQAFAEVLDVPVALANLGVRSKALGLFTPAMNNPGVVDLILDPGGNWWEDANAKVAIGAGAFHLRANDEKRYTASILRTLGSVDTDDFIGNIANDTNARLIGVKPGTVSGQWTEVTGGVVRTFTDDGAGNITGTGLDAASSMDYRTGGIALRASGVENVKDGTVSASFDVAPVQFDGSDTAVHRIGLVDGFWKISVHMAFRNLSATNRTIKAALTDDLSSVSTQLTRHLWRTNSRPINVKGDETVGLTYEWTIEVRSTALRNYLSLRAVASLASTVTLDSVQITVEKLDA